MIFYLYEHDYAGKLPQTTLTHPSMEIDIWRGEWDDHESRSLTRSYVNNASNAWPVGQTSTSNIAWMLIECLWGRIDPKKILRLQQ